MNTDFLTPYAKEMTEYALNNPCLNHLRLVQGVKSGEFAKDMTVFEKRIITVQLNVMPTENPEITPPFWYCSVSLHSLKSGLVKPSKLWTNFEKRYLQDILLKFLEGRGEKGVQDFGVNDYAMMIFRQMTRRELRRTGWERPKSSTIEA